MTTAMINIEQLVSDMKGAANTVLNEDMTKLKGFSERQMKAIAKHARLVALGIASGDICEETKEFFLDNIKDMVFNFVKTLEGLVMITIEKICQAIVNVLWQMIKKITAINTV